MRIHTKCKFAANIEHHLCIKFGTEFSISPKIVVFWENLGWADNLLSYRGSWVFRGAGGVLGKFCCTGGAEPLRVLRKVRGAETLLETIMKLC